ncbi:MAG: hypothetical protein HQ523_06385 [Lentisphaerae bacterium]|nr:hypothetical protein [Lentisphaerota bacterium]
MKRRATETSRLVPAVVLCGFVVVVGLVFLVMGGGRPRAKVVSPTPSTTPAAPRVYSSGQEPVQGLDIRALPGVRPTTMIHYRQPGIAKVMIAGSWDGWKVKRPLTRRGDLWVFDIADLEVGVGRFEYKFLPNGHWEPGENRLFFVNKEGKLQRPRDIIFTARMERSDRIDVYFGRPLHNRESVTVELAPEVPIRTIEWDTGRDGRELLGYAVAGDFVTFCMSEPTYGTILEDEDRVTVAGSFNGWDAASGAWELKRIEKTRLWQGVFSLGAVQSGAGSALPEFKFVINGSRWLDPPLLAPNAESDNKGHVNMVLDPTLSSSPVLHIHTTHPLDLSVGHTVVLESEGEQPAYAIVTPGAALDRIVSQRQLGVLLDHERKRTGFRLFAPRASSVELCFYDGPQGQVPGQAAGLASPSETVPMMRNRSDGVWDVWVDELRIGAYYSYRVDGAQGTGDGFNAERPVGDPYARAMVNEDGHSIVIDPTAGRSWFKGWTDTAWRSPAWSDMVIYETHVRDLTSHRSSGVAPELRGRYAGILASEGTGTGLDHLKALGINMIELMPVHEFQNGITDHGWGYSPVFFFAPESSYGQAPLEGSHYYEFKHLVNELHQRGFGVILDVVYNHVGAPNVFSLIDNKYYFRMDHEFRYSNFSGCGNDVRSEGPMVRRLLIENVLYWMEEHHVDGFRFDLAELIDMETLTAIRDAARKVNPNVVLISEPWSFRGDHKMALKGKGWSAWNNQFRDAVKGFAKGEGDRSAVKASIRGSVDSFAATPLQSINYLESHDDSCLADDLTEDAKKDGRNLSAVDARRNRLAATILFTSLGVPMISEGQEYIRSKRGLHNTYNKGDAINQLRWDERKRPEAATTLRYYRDLIALRRSKAGGSLQWSMAVPDDYIQWIEPRDERALGYAINVEGRYPGARFMVLANSGDADVTFALRFPSLGWKQIGDGSRINVNGIVDATGRPRLFSGGAYKVKVPAQTAYIFAGA